MKKMWHWLTKKFLIWLMQTNIYELVLLHILPNIRFTTKPSDVEGWQHEQLDAILEPGDFLVAIDTHNATGAMIPKVTGGAIINGEEICVSHAAFCVAKGEGATKCGYEIAEMEAEGYTRSTFYDICKRADRVLICTCTDWDADYKQKMIAKCFTFKKAHYNVQFALGMLKMGVRFLACSELVYENDFEHRLKVNLEDSAGIGRPYISPKGLLQAKNIVIKADSAKLVKPTED